MAVRKTAKAPKLAKKSTRVPKLEWRDFSDAYTTEYAYVRVWATVQPGPKYYVAEHESKHKLPTKYLAHTCDKDGSDIRSWRIIGSHRTKAAAQRACSQHNKKNWRANV